MKDYLIKNYCEVPLYRGHFILLLTNSADKVKDEIPDFSKEDVYAHTYLGGHKKKYGYYVILNYNSPYKEITHGCIAHEALHAANFIAATRGIEPSFENDEPMAYLIEWITDVIYRFSKKHKYTPS